PHVGVAAFVQHDLGEFGMGRDLALRPPTVELLDQPAQGPAGLRLQFVGLDHGARGFEQGDAALAGMIVQKLHGGVAKPALGHVDDALEGEIVGRRIDNAQIGQRIADFRALVEARAADHAIGQAEGDKAVFELAHLVGGAHQDRDLVEPVAPALDVLDLFADPAGFLFRIPRAGDGDLLAIDILGAQRLAEPALIVGDQMRGGGEDMAGGTIVALQPDHLGAGKIVFEAQDVVDLGAAPAVDRLVVVADAAEVFGVDARGGYGALPLPVLHGERVGVRGSLHEFSPWRVPLTRIAAQSDL